MLVRHGIDEARAQRLAGFAHGSVGRALELQADEGFEPLLARLLASLAALDGAASVASAAAPFYEEKERQEAILGLLEAIGRDRMALQNGVGTEALAPGELEGVRADGRRLMCAAMEARRMLAANVAWQNIMDALYFSLV